MPATPAPSSPAAQAPASPQTAPATAGETAAAPPARRRTGLIVAIIVIVALVAAAIVGWLLWQNHQREHQLHSLAVTFSLADFNEGSSPIPIRVEGTDFEGNEVATTYLLNAPKDSIDLARGQYTVQAAGTPVNQAGTVYETSTAQTEVVVDYDGAHTGDVEGPIELSWTYNAIPAETLTDESLAAVETWLRDNGVDEAEVTRLMNAARTARQTRLDEIAAEEAARKAAEEEAARKAAEERAAALANPSSVDAREGKRVTLKGHVTRVRGDSADLPFPYVGYFLEFTQPITMTYSVNGQTITGTVDRVQLGAIEGSAASPDSFDFSQRIAALEPYVGEDIAITGTWNNTGNSHTHAAVQLTNTNTAYGTIEVL